MNLHIGLPNYPGCLRFHQGTISAGLDKDKRKQEIYFEHPIKRWYGISFARLFIGVIKTEPTRDVREGSFTAGQ